MSEVTIGGIDRHFILHGEGAYQEISIGTLNPFGSAEVKKRGCQYMFSSMNTKIGKASQVGFEFFELRVLLNAGKKLLPNGTDHLNAVITDQIS